MREFKSALEEARERLDVLEQMLRCPTPPTTIAKEDTSNEDYVNPKIICKQNNYGPNSVLIFQSRLLAACHSTMDVVQHLHEFVKHSDSKPHQIIETTQGSFLIIAI